MIQDDDRLELMADHILSARVSERSAADTIADKDQGHSKTSTARRLRRKFAQKREQLLAAATYRRQRQKESPAKRRRGSPTASGGTRTSVPLASLPETPAFLSDLQRRFDLTRETVDRLGMPFVLEEIAQLATATTDPIVHTDRFSAAKLPANPAADTDRFSAAKLAATSLADTDRFSAAKLPTDLAANRELFRTLTGDTAREINPIREQMRAITGLSGTDLSTRDFD